MDAANDPAVREIWCQKSSQVGWTTILENVIGNFMDQDPAPMLLVQPTLEIAEAFSKDRLAPMLRDTPRLAGLVQDPKSRDSGNTLLHKKFPGGHITLAGANSESSLSSRPIRIVLFDEVDRFPPSAGSGGDPINLAIVRTTNFWNALVLGGSSPGDEEFSRIQKAVKSGDERRWFVPCPKCKGEQYVKWAQIFWDKDEAGNHLPETAHYRCEICKKNWTEAERYRALEKGRWRATSKGLSGIASFYIWAGMSPWLTLPKMVSKFLEANRGGRETVKVWVNTTLGETSKDYGEKADQHEIESRAEDYPSSPVPEGVLVVTAGVDTQDNRLELEIVGWGKDQESWSLDYRVLYGDPSGPALWRDLTEIFKERFKHPAGHELPISVACIDSGGHHTQTVYEYCRGMYRRRIFAIKGAAGQGRPIMAKKPSMNNILKAPVFIVGVDAAKDALFSRLKIEKPGPGYCHFPQRYGPEYFEQLTNEKAMTRYRHGNPVRVYVRIGRNEPLDCRVYGMAALDSLGVDLNRLHDSRARGGVSSGGRRGRRPRRSARR